MIEQLVPGNCTVYLIDGFCTLKMLWLIKVPNCFHTPDLKDTALIKAIDVCLSRANTLAWIWGKKTRMIRVGELPSPLLIHDGGVRELVWPVECIVSFREISNW